jgi:hypothetical protein
MIAYLILGAALCNHAAIAISAFQAPAANRAHHLKPDNRASAPAEGGASPRTSPRHGTDRPRKGNPADQTRTTEGWGMQFLNLN